MLARFKPLRLGPVTAPGRVLTQGVGHLLLPALPASLLPQSTLCPCPSSFPSAVWHLICLKSRCLLVGLPRGGPHLHHPVPHVVSGLVLVAILGTRQRRGKDFTFPVRKSSPLSWTAHRQVAGVLGSEAARHGQPRVLPAQVDLQRHLGAGDKDARSHPEHYRVPVHQGLWDRLQQTRFCG